jgi:hypothetical protein
MIRERNYIGASIDDYCICNSSFLQNIVSFNVGDFEPTLSDHCPIFVKIENSKTFSFTILSVILHVPESLFSYDFIIFSKSSHNAS